MSDTIAIDGPAGAGKSTIAKLVAKHKNYIYVDTGAMYRAMGLYMVRQGIDVKDEEAVSKACQDVTVSIQYKDGEQIVLLNGENVNGSIRTQEIGAAASAVAAYPPVRVKLVELQQQLAQKENVVMDGRDIGTCVLPNANLKIYLTASSYVRAKRRYDELVAKGETCDLSQIEAEVIERDVADTNRTHSPLRQAEDAILLDSSNMNIEEVVNAIIGYCK